MVKVALIGAKYFPLFNEIADKLIARDLQVEIIQDAQFGSQIFIEDENKFVFLKQRKIYDVVKDQKFETSSGSQFVESLDSSYRSPSCTEITSWLSKELEKNGCIMQKAAILKYSLLWQAFADI